jgi:hypothetical protein
LLIFIFQIVITLAKGTKRLAYEVIFLLIVERFIGNALNISLGVWHFATKGIIY